MNDQYGLPIRIDLPDGFLDEEIRCGYKVSPKMKRIWAVQLDMYDVIKNVCNKHGIKFCVYWGTLLGAVRHKGFIPWDDDFDVCMEREDFERFCSLPQEEFGEPYFLQTALSDRKYWIPIARFRNSMTTGAIKGMMSPDYNNGIYIDIYPLDGLPRNRLLRAIHSFFVHMFIQPISSYYMKTFPKGVQGHAKRLIKPFARLLPYKVWYRLYVWILSFPTKWCSKIASLYDYRPEVYKAWILKDKMRDLLKVPYEFTEVPIIADSSEVLSRAYGNFMDFPPLENRGTWHGDQLVLDPNVPYKEYFKHCGIVS